jgi:hypothetical protein
VVLIDQDLLTFPTSPAPPCFSADESGACEEPDAHKDCDAPDVGRQLLGWVDRLPRIGAAFTAALAAWWAASVIVASR